MQGYKKQSRGKTSEMYKKYAKKDISNTFFYFSVFTIIIAYKFQRFKTISTDSNRRCPEPE